MRLFLKLFLKLIKYKINKLFNEIFNKIFKSFLFMILELILIIGIYFFYLIQNMKSILCNFQLKLLLLIHYNFHLQIL